VPLNVASLPGDGIGPEVCDAAVRVLDALPIDVRVEKIDRADGKVSLTLA